MFVDKSRAVAVVLGEKDNKDVLEKRKRSEKRERMKMNRWVLYRAKGLKGAYSISSNCEFIQYCDSNIGLFSIALHLVIALPTLR